MRRHEELAARRVFAQLNWIVAREAAPTGKVKKTYTKMPGNQRPRPTKAARKTERWTKAVNQARQL